MAATGNLLYLLVPSLATNAVGHYEASELTQSDNTAVDGLTDLSGAGNHVAQSDSAKKPKFLNAALVAQPAIIAGSASVQTSLEFSVASIPVSISQVTVAFAGRLTDTTKRYVASMSSGSGLTDAPYFEVQTHSLKRYTAATNLQEVDDDTAVASGPLRRLYTKGSGATSNHMRDLTTNTALTIGFRVDGAGSAVAPTGKFQLIWEAASSFELSMFAMWTRVLTTQEQAWVKMYVDAMFPAA